VANILLKRCGKEKQRGGGDVGRGGGRRGGKEARDLFTLQRLEGGKGRGGRGTDNKVKRKSQTRRRAALTRGGGNQDRERVMEVEFKGGREGRS